MTPALALLLAAGCADTRDDHTWNSSLDGTRTGASSDLGGPARTDPGKAALYDNGLIVCLSGAGGMMGESERLRDGLANGGVDRAIEIFSWSGGGVMEDQTDVEANRRKAAQLSRRIEDYRKSYPARPVHLVGVSAGTGLVVWALEALSDGVQATGAVLISSSLDTRYDLTRALGKVTDHIYSFNSVADTVLSLGVTWAGTVDRGGGLAGGLVGFSPADGAAEETRALYRDKLTQISWNPGDVFLGHLGDHLGATNPAFVKARIAPLVLGKAPAVINGNGKNGKALTEDYAREIARRKEEEAERKAAEKAAADAKAAEDAKKAQDAARPAAPKVEAPKVDPPAAPPPPVAPPVAPPPAPEKAPAKSSAKPKAQPVSSPHQRRFVDWRVTVPERGQEEARFLSDSAGRLP
jgi:pimeloyl-ACP methyl ester carboxylesterase